MARNCVQSFNVEMLQSIKDTPQKLCHVVLLKLIIIGSEQMYYLQSSSSSLRLQHYITIGIVECNRFYLCCVALFLLILVPLMVNRTIFGTNCSDFCYFHLQQINYQENKRMVSCVFNLKYLSQNLVKLHM